MVLEVRSAPPVLLLALVLLSLSPLPPPANAQESRTSAESPNGSEAKARLLQELDQQIEERRTRLAREEEALAALKRALEAAKQALVEERDRLEALRRQVEADIARRKAVTDERLGQIAKVYGSMKPKEAAEALEKMDDDMAANILERLPNRTVGRIFDLMPKDRVRELTTRLEGGRAGKGE